MTALERINEMKSKEYFSLSLAFEDFGYLMKGFEVVKDLLIKEAEIDFREHGFPENYKEIAIDFVNEEFEKGMK